jgi:hypothetical protein
MGGKKTNPTTPTKSQSRIPTLWKKVNSSPTLIRALPAPTVARTPTQPNPGNISTGSSTETTFFSSSSSTVQTSVATSPGSQTRGLSTPKTTTLKSSSLGLKPGTTNSQELVSPPKAKIGWSTAKLSPTAGGNWTSLNPTAPSSDPSTSNIVISNTDILQKPGTKDMDSGNSSSTEKIENLRSNNMEVSIVSLLDFPPLFPKTADPGLDTESKKAADVNLTSQAA